MTTPKHQFFFVAEWPKTDYVKGGTREFDTDAFERDFGVFSVMRAKVVAESKVKENPRLADKVFKISDITFSESHELSTLNGGPVLVIWIGFHIECDCFFYFTTALQQELNKELMQYDSTFFYLGHYVNQRTNTQNLMDFLDKILQADALSGLRTLPDACIQMCVTSPPYWAKRQYGTDLLVWGGIERCKHQWNGKKQKDKRKSFPDPRRRDQALREPYIYSGTCSKCGAWKGELGQEPSPELFVAHLVSIFREVRRVLKDDGVCFVNLGDTYWGGKGRSGAYSSETAAQRKADGHIYARTYQETGGQGHMRPQDGKHHYLKPKDLCLIPPLFAIAMQQDGWYLRNEIIWSKKNGMPESVTDRFVNRHETISLFSKNRQYYFDWKAVANTVTDSTVQRVLRDGPPATFGNAKHADYEGIYSKNAYKPLRKAQPDGDPTMAINGGTFRNGHSGYFDSEGKLIGDGTSRCRDVWEFDTPSDAGLVAWMVENGYLPAEQLSAALAHLRQALAMPDDVWQFATAQYNDAHFAVFPVELPRRCILAGSRLEDVVLDPFMGAGTTALVAHQLGRQYVGMEPNPANVKLAEGRINREILGLERKAQQRPTEEEAKFLAKYKAHQQKLDSGQTKRKMKVPDEFRAAVVNFGQQTLFSHE